MPDCRIVGTSLDDLDDDGFRDAGPQACDEFARRDVTDEQWAEFEPQAPLRPPGRRAGRPARAAVGEAEAELGGEPRRLHYLSVPPEGGHATWCRCSARPAWSSGPGSSWRSRSAPTCASARALNASLHETFAEDQIFRIDHFLGKEAAQNILAFRFANGLFEPIWNRNHIDHVQIDVPETLALGRRDRLLREHRRLPRHGRHPPVPGARLHGDGAADRARAPARSARRRTRSSARCCPIEPSDVVRGQYIGYRDEPGVAPDSETETFVALRCEIDNWRWAGVPFFLRTGKRMAEGARIISIAFREPPKSMFPPGSGVGAQGPDHLTFDLADASKLSLSFYGKRPGPGHAARQAEPAVRAARDGPGGRRARGLRAADPRRDERRPHAVHHGRGHRAAVGAVDAAARGPAARCGPTRPARGDPTPSTSSSRPTPGGCRSSGPGAKRPDSSFLRANLSPWQQIRTQNGVGGRPAQGASWKMSPRARRRRAHLARAVAHGRWYGDPGRAPGGRVVGEHDPVAPLEHRWPWARDWARGRCSVSTNSPPV